LRLSGAPALARPAVSEHMWAMSGRPCNPGSDLRQLWQILLGKNTPFPQCGAPDKQDEVQTDRAADGERDHVAADQRNR
jgi:hypothetical protein